MHAAKFRRFVLVSRRLPVIVSQEPAQPGLAFDFGKGGRAATRSRRCDTNGVIPQALMRAHGVVEGFEFTEQVLQVALTEDDEMFRHSFFTVRT